MKITFKEIKEKFKDISKELQTNNNEYEEAISKYRLAIKELKKKIQGSNISNEKSKIYIKWLMFMADIEIKKKSKKENKQISKNPWFIRKSLVADSTDFTSKLGVKFRKKISPVLKKIIKSKMNSKLIVEDGYTLDKNKQYIFVSTHYFSEDIMASVAAIKNPAYLVLGTTNQIESNPLMIAASLIGFIHVDRLDKDSRKECLKKQKALIDYGTSFINFVEGGWNNTENLLLNEPFSGPYITSKETQIEIVPISSYYNEEENEIYTKIGQPMNLMNYDAETANQIIRDTLATMMYEQIEKHSKILHKDNLPYDQHTYFMQERAKEYCSQLWTKDVWDEELTVRKSKKIVDERETLSFLDNLSRATLVNNSAMLAPLLAKKDEYERYDVKKYMHENWQNYVSPKAKVRTKNRSH